MREGCINVDELKQLTQQEVTQLCAQIRDFLVQSVSKTGGHLASNLGVVELTIAMHRVFDSPKDKFIWDVGHQAYVHKLLTGRWEQFSTLRQSGGLSGFPNPEESEHDCFLTGHASTSLSAAIGFACARKQLQQEHYIVAVIGDGALTGGLALEALNHIGSAKLPLIIILNDNNMSISRNVGAIHLNLNRLRSGKRYIGIKKRISKSFPAIARVLEKIKNSVKYIFLSSSFFEEMGIKYLGPFDGHDERTLEEVLEKSKNFDVPVLLHVLTTKGKGYQPAENNPEQFHGISPVSNQNNLPKQHTVSTISNSAVFAQTVCTLAESNPRIVAVTAAMPDGTGLHYFAKRFPERFYDVGIAEGHAATFCAGLAAGGAQPVFAVYSSFLQRAFDQVLHDICLQKLPVVIGIDRAGPVGEDGATHHGVYDIGMLTQMPNMALMAPSTQEELETMVSLAFAHAPAAIRYPRNVLPNQPLKQPLEWGRWEWKTKIEPIMFVAEGAMVEVAWKAILLLRKANVSAGLINVRFLAPMDLEAIEKIADCQLICTVEDGVYSGGMGEHIARLLSNMSSKCEQMFFAVPDQPLPHGSMSYLYDLAGLTADSIANAVLTKLSVPGNFSLEKRGRLCMKK